MKKSHLKTAAILFILLSLTNYASAQDIAETVGGINTLLYGVAAGIAALMITFHAIKWKTAGSPAERDAAKRGILNVVLGLILIIIAASLVEMVYKKPDAGSVPQTITITSFPAPGSALLPVESPRRLATPTSFPPGLIQV